MLSINCEGSLTPALPMNIHVNTSFTPPPQVDVPTASAVEAEARVEPSGTESSVPVASAAANSAVGKKRRATRPVICSDSDASVEPSDTERSVPVASAVVQESTKVCFRRPHDQVCRRLHGRVIGGASMARWLCVGASVAG